MPITVDTLGEIKRDQTENFCLLFVNVLLSPSLYMLIQLFSEIEVNSGRIFTDMRSMEVNILIATIHRDADVDVATLRWEY